jgi:type III secretion system low calcium response chaperone LcrH/SycD
MSFNKLAAIDPNVIPKDMPEEVNKVLQKMHDHKLTLKEAMGVSDDFLEEMYSVAYNYYEQGKLKESLSLFQILVGICPENFRFAFGIASAHHQLGQYYDAAGAYALALSNEPLNPVASFYLADCYYRLDFKKETREALELTVELCEQDERYATIREQSLLMLNKLKKK